jgi:hypothetical protein
MAEITLDTGNGQQIASVIRKASIGDLASKPASRRSRHHQELQGHGGAVEHTVLRKFGRSRVPSSVTPRLGLQEFQSVTHLTLV